MKYIHKKPGEQLTEEELENNLQYALELRNRKRKKEGEEE